MGHPTHLIFMGVLFCTAAGGLESPANLSDAGIDKLASLIEQACPATAGDVSAGRDQCAVSLGNITELSQASLNDTVSWGGHIENDYVPAHNALTLLNALVWRKIYLSLFEFSGHHRLEILPDDSRLLHLDARLRHLPYSEYPYPFWHSENKWHAYQQTVQISLLFKGGKLLAGYRETSRGLPTTDHEWTGFWSTDDEGKEPPRTALFSYLLSADNPNEPRLTATYKAMAMEARKYECAECHTPANPGNMNPLLILNLPGQALSGRHEIVYQIRNNLMPPGQGISDEAARQRLLLLARDFESVGDKALAYEQLHVVKPHASGAGH